MIFTTQKRNSIAVMCMLVTILFWSLTPIFVELSGAKNAPFSFAFVSRLAESAGVLILLFLVPMTKKLRMFSWDNIVFFFKKHRENKILAKALIIAALSCIDIVIFSISIHFIDISTATVFYESWPIILVFCLSILFRYTNKYQIATPTLYILVGMAFLGFVFVLAGESATKAPAFNKWLLLGISLSIIAGAVGAVGTSYSIRYCEDIRVMFNTVRRIDPGDLYCVLIYLAISRPLAAGIAAFGMMIHDEIISNNLLI